MAEDISVTLQERGKRYGSFKDQAVIAQGLKDVMQRTSNWVGLSPDKKECLDMLANKIGRILNGDPEYRDSWHDMAGYSKLVADTLSDVPGELVPVRKNHTLLLGGK